MAEKQRDEQKRRTAVELPPGVKLLHTIEGHQKRVMTVAFDPQGETLASGSYDHTVRLWHAQSGKWLRTLEGHDESVRALAFDPQGSTLASGSADHTVRLWEVRTGKLLHTLKGHDDWVRSVAFYPPDGTLASGSDDGSVKLWETRSGRLLRTLKGHERFVLSVAFDAQTATLASGGADRTLKFWDVRTGRLLSTLEGHLDAVASLAFDGHGERLASGSSDNTVRLWDPRTGKLLQILEGHKSAVDIVIFSADGRLLTSKSNDGTIRLWDCRTWETVAVIPEPTLSDNLTPALAFHPRLPLLAASGSEPYTPERERARLIHLWELDFDLLLGKRHAARPVAPVEVSVQHRTAKVILVGDAGVGKSGLAQRLALGKFIDTRSSHARRTLVLDSSTVKTTAGADEHREMVLWDLAGQPAYRLVHQLAMDAAAGACVLFDPRSETNPLEGAAYWSQALDQARTNAPIARLLVPARMDVGGLPVSNERLQAFAQEHGFVGVFPTSAFTGKGCDALLKAIREHVRWEDLPVVSSTETLAALREFVARLKGEKTAQAPPSALRAPSPPLGERDGKRGTPALLSIAELHRRFEADYGKPVPLDKFIAYLQRLEDTDEVDVLAFHSVGQEPKPETFVLLDPTRVDAYASALLVAAKDEPDGPGHLSESRVRNGEFNLPESERVGDKEAERHLLWFVMESLFSRDLVLREKIKGEDYVVFPAQCTRELKFTSRSSRTMRASASGSSSRTRRPITLTPADGVGCD
jgi:small GTP-binding protein